MCQLDVLLFLKKLINMEEDFNKPYDNYFLYSNKRWIEENKVPDSLDYYSLGSYLDEITEKNLMVAIRKISSDPSKRDHYQDLLYKYFISSNEMIDGEAKASLNTLKNWLLKVDRISDKKDFARMVGEINRHGAIFLWTFDPFVDRQYSKNTLLKFGGYHMSLAPGKYVYKNRYKKELLGYKKYYNDLTKVIKYFNFLPFDEVLEFETKIAEAIINHYSDKERDIRIPLDEFLSRYQGFDWITYFKALNVKNYSDNLSLEYPKIYQEIFKVIGEKDAMWLKKYLAWRFVNSVAKYASPKLNSIHHSFYWKVLKRQDIFKYIPGYNLLNIDKTFLGVLATREYEKYFINEEIKADFLNVIEYIRNSFIKQLDDLTWLNVSKDKIKHRLEKITFNISNQKYVKSYSKINFDENNYFKNIMTLRRINLDERFSNIGKTLKKDDWFSSSGFRTYASNSFLTSEQYYSAAYLQYPLYNLKMSFYEKVCAIGFIIAHEFAHNFDPNGILYDENNNKNLILSKDEYREYKKLIKSLKKQIDNYRIKDKTPFRGKIQICEVMSDLIAFKVILKALKEDGYTSKEDIENIIDRFAKTFACTQSVDSLLKNSNSCHPPQEVRVNLVLSNIDDFYDIFDVQPQDKMYVASEDRCRIWPN